MDISHEPCVFLTYCYQFSLLRANGPTRREFSFFLPEESTSGLDIWCRTWGQWCHIQKQVTIIHKQHLLFSQSELLATWIPLMCFYDKISFSVRYKNGPKGQAICYQWGESPLGGKITSIVVIFTVGQVNTFLFHRSVKSKTATSAFSLRPKRNRTSICGEQLIFAFKHECWPVR